MPIVSVSLVSAFFVSIGIGHCHDIGIGIGHCNDISIGIGIGLYYEYLVSVSASTMSNWYRYRPIEK